MSIFNFSHYKDFVHFFLKNQPARGHGQLSRIAKALNIHTSLVSHILNGDKHFNFEQACDLAHYLNLNELEQEYLIALVLYARAGTPLAKRHCEKEIKKIKKKSQLLKEHIRTDIVLSDVNSALFFSQWYYAAVKIIVALPGFTNPERIAETLGLPLRLVIELLEFLIQSGLLILENGNYHQGHSKIHLSSDSPFVSRHHANWRIKAMGQLDLKKEENLFYTMPANLSHQDAQKIRNLLMETLQKSTEIVDLSQAETMYCLNLDWMKIV